MTVDELAAKVFKAIDGDIGAQRALGELSMLARRNEADRTAYVESAAANSRRAAAAERQLGELVDAADDLRLWEPGRRGWAAAWSRFLSRLEAAR